MEEIIFKVGVQTGNTAKDIDKINKELEGVDKAAKQTSKDMYNLSAKFEDIYGDLQPLSSRLGEIEDRMYELALAGKKNTDEFRALQSEVVRYRQAIIETDRSVDLLAEQGRGLGTALQIGSGIVAGYGAIQGAMALVGNESENLQKVMVKLQAVQAVLQSMEQIKLVLDQKAVLLTSLKVGATKALTVAQTVYTTAVGTTTGAMKALRLAMLALPIVAIIAGIVALVSAIASLVSEEEKAEEANEALTRSYERQQVVMDRVMSKRLRDIDNEMKLRKSQGADAEELHQLEIKRLKEIEAQRRVTMSQEKKMIDNRKVQYQQALKEGNNELAKSIKEEITQHRNKYRDLKTMEGQFQIDKQVLENEFKKKQAEEAAEERKKNADAYKARKEKEKKEKEERLKLEEDFIKTMRDLELAALEESGYKQLEILRTQQERERAELIKKFGERSELVKQLETKQAKELSDLTTKLNEENQTKVDEENAKIRAKEAANRKAQLEGELLAMQEDFTARQELRAQLALLEMQQELANTELTEGEKFKIQEEYNAKIRELDKETAEHNLKLQTELREAQYRIAEQSFHSAQNLSDAYFATRLAQVEKGSREEEKLARRQFAINKALQLAGAVMDGSKAITASLASSPIAIGPLPNPAGIASLAFATTTSIANIAKILATKFEGGATSVSAPTPPPISPTQATQTPINQFNGTSSTLTSQSTTQVVVVDSDITAQQQNTARVKALSTIM